MTKYYTEQPVSDKYVKNKTAWSLVALALFICGSLFTWHGIKTRPQENLVSAPLRSGLFMNEWIFSHLFSEHRLAKEYSPDKVVQPRFNGNYGTKSDADTANWMLHLVRKPGDTVLITMADIRALPKHEVIFDFRCIEGWSVVTRWEGVRFRDFMAHYGLTDQSQMKYVSLVTPDEQYYVGIDMASMMHPQTLLCYEVNNKTLPMDQGYPLRLIIPVKYGVKHLKRIGSISFADERPKDFWYEQGYDYFCGL